jgi:hypothetical protein
LLPDGSDSRSIERSGDPEAAARIGDDCAKDLIASAGPAFMAKLVS